MADPSNTIGTGTYGSSWRAKYFSTKLQSVLRNALVCEKIMTVDNSDSFYIHNPYTTQPTALVQAMAYAGTYSVSAWSITDDSLTVTDEVIYSNHVYDFQRVMNNYNLVSERLDQVAYSIAFGIDKFALNVLCEDGTGTYTTPAGGFTTAANIPIIVSNLVAKVMGYADTYKGLFLVIENTDVVGFMQAQVGSGFSYADAALNNGFMANYMGVDIYVVRTGTFVSTDIGSRLAITNSGHRVFGVKNVTTYASPRGVQYEEKSVGGRTGKEIVAYGYVGAKVWTQNAGLIIDVTLA
jgi:hypothetical protein